MRRLGTILRILFSVAACAATGPFTIIVMALFVVNVTNPLVIASFVLIACPTAVIIHELGHLLAAFLVGFQVSEFRAWPISVVRGGSGFHLRFGLRRWSPLGFVAAAPRNWRRLRVRWGLFVASGPLANLAVGAVLIVPGGMLLAATPKPGDDGLLKSIHTTTFQAGSATMLMAAINLAFCFANLVSTPIGGHRYDGVHLLDCVLNYPGIRRTIAVMRLAADLRSGQRPREWNPATVEDMLSYSDGSAVDINARLFGYYHALDCGQTDRAATLLRQALADWQRYPVPNQAWLVLEGSYLAGFFDRDFEACRLWLLRAGEGAAEKQTRLRAEAALAFAEGRYGDAVRLAELGLEAAPHSADPGGKLAEIDWLNDMLAESRKRVQENNPEIPIAKSSPTALK